MKKYIILVLASFAFIGSWFIVESASRRPMPSEIDTLVGMFPGCAFVGGVQTNAAETFGCVDTLSYNGPFFYMGWKGTNVAGFTNHVRLPQSVKGVNGLRYTIMAGHTNVIIVTNIYSQDFIPGDGVASIGTNSIFTINPMKTRNFVSCGTNWLVY